MCWDRSFSRGRSVYGTHRPWCLAGPDSALCAHRWIGLAMTPSRGYHHPTMAASLSCISNTTFIKCRTRAFGVWWGIIMLVNRPFALIKNHQGSKRKVSQEPWADGMVMLAAPSSADRDAGGGKSVWKPLRMVSDCFSSFFCLYIWPQPSAYVLANHDLAKSCAWAHILLCPQNLPACRGEWAGREGR